MGKRTIRSVYGREILNSRGDPTVEAVVILEDGSTGRAAVPSGSSTGQYEAKELRDDMTDRYNGKGVLGAVENINHDLASKLIGMSASSQFAIDEAIHQADGSEDFSVIGANAALAASLACARAASSSYQLPLYRYIGGNAACTLPVPMMNLINGGAHAKNNLDIQEFMVMPVGAENYTQALEWCCKIYHCLGRLLEQKGLSLATGDEGGFSPDLQEDEEALQLLMKAIEDCGLHPYQDIVLALDAAASQWKEQQGDHYILPKRRIRYTTEELLEYWCDLSSRYPLCSLEDPFCEDDWQGFSQITHRLHNTTQIVGDDLFVTNEKRLRQGIYMDAATAILIKPNQIGTLSKTTETILKAHRAGYRTILSHRSGETEDTTIADLAVAFNAGQIKSGAPVHAERVAKYNQLLRIEQGLGKSAKWMGKDCFAFRSMF